MKIQVTLPDELGEWVDGQRGFEPVSSFVRRLLEAERDSKSGVVLGRPARRVAPKPGKAARIEKAKAVIEEPVEEARAPDPEIGFKGMAANIVRSKDRPFRPQPRK